MMMVRQKPLPDIWLKAAMLGSLWASIEILLGSFLHNLHMPLTGTLLAALGVILMINGYKLWPDKGIFWRTALITAAMKSISPSAIIFGPMVGILMEGVILEVSVRLFRGHWVGFLIGGALAVSSSLFQKIVVMLMTYGPDFVKLYEQLYFVAARSLKITEAVPVDLVKLIFIIDLSFGALVAALAVRTSSHQKTILLAPNDENTESLGEDLLATSVSQKYSLPLLFINLLILIAGLIRLDDLTLLAGSILVVLYVSFNIIRYARSLRRLKNPKIWIQLITLMVLSGLLLGGWENQQAIINGFHAGWNMSIRALLVIFGFSALSIEIRNPVIMSWFNQRGMGILFKAMSVAFEVLPRLIKLVSDKKHIWRHPFLLLNQLLGALEQLRIEHINTAKVLLLSGSQGTGKTNLVKRILDSDKFKAFSFSGFYTDGKWVDDERDAYHILDLKSRKSELLCERKAPISKIKAGPFNFRLPGIEFGQNILADCLVKSSSVVVIDEIGHLELDDQGWSEGVKALVAQNRRMIWTVRPSLLDQVVAKWPVHYFLVEVGNSDDKALEDEILNFFR